MSLDIFNPQVSKVAKGLDGKVFTVYGNNALGKTKESVKFPKPLYLAFEKGLNAIAGVPFMPINKWSDFMKVNKQITNPKTLEQAKEMYQTIVFDEVETAARYCTKYVCDKYDAESIAKGNGGFGLWKEYETAFWTEIDQLVSSGFTIVFIAHRTFDEDGKAWPKGDKRALAPVIDNSDIVVYLESNGVDEKGNVIKSSAYMAETDRYFARSRFDYIVPGLKVWTAKAMEEAVIKAIEKQEEIEGIQAVTYEEQKETKKSDELDFNTIRKEIITIGKALNNAGRIAEINQIIEKRLGKDKTVKDFTPDHVEVMSMVLDDLKDIDPPVAEEPEQD